MINKKRIYDGSNIQEHKEIFYKYLNKLLYLELKILNTDLAIYADEHGDKESMESFSTYIGKHFPRNLIDNNSFDFINSKEEVLIQVADFVAGTISYGYEEKKKCKEYQGYFALLNDRLIILRPWPTPNIFDSLRIIDDDKYDREIAENCIRLASAYIEKHQGSEIDEQVDQVLILNLLLQEVYLNPNKYRFIDYLIKYIEARTKRNYKKRIFQTKIIAPLRDAGVIISSSKQGLKIPVTTKELYLYTEQTLGQTIPMLDRLERARERILAITNNEIDIVGEDKYQRIRDYMDKRP